jgi:hypothetical protein
MQTGLASFAGAIVDMGGSRSCEGRRTGVRMGWDRGGVVQEGSKRK